MLGENIKKLRKRKGYSQETLAQQLNVVRQTVSKWEKGISVPDADMLTTIAELLDVTVGELLGAKEEKPDTACINDIAAQLAILNEQLASQNRRRRKTVRMILFGILTVIAVPVIIAVIVAVFGFVYYLPSEDETITSELVCALHGEGRYETVITAT